MSEHESTGSTFDRRSALKKAAVAGAVAWTAPVVLSSGASAMDGTCTPKCLPAVGSSLTWAGTGCQGNSVLTLQYRYSTPTCPCGGDAVLGALQLSSTAGTATESGGIVTVTIASFSIPSEFTLTVVQAASCSDRADDPCASTCTTVYTMGTGVPDGESCFDSTGNASVFPESSGCVASSA